MDLSKLLDLIVKERLLLPRIAELSSCDPYECMARPDYSQTAREVLQRRIIDRKEFAPESAQDSGADFFQGMNPFWPKQGSFEDRIKKMSQEELIRADWFLEYSRLSHELVCSCWYAGQTESDAMWRLYCEHVGVAITTTVGRLKKAVRYFVPKVLSPYFRLSLAKVIYQDSTCCGDNLPWLIKRKAFEHEEEVRLYVDYPLVSAPGLSLQIDPRQLIEKITVTPYAEKWQSEAILATVKELMRVPGEVARLVGPLTVTQSKQMDPCAPTWPRHFPDWQLPFISGVRIHEEHT